MPAIDPTLNQTLWWFLLGAFSGWLLWLLIDRLFWRDGVPADGFDVDHAANLRTALLEARREEALLRSELQREQEESQRLTATANDLRSRLEGQDQMVATLEAALDAARYGSRTGPTDGAAAGAAALVSGSAIAAERLSADHTPAAADEPHTLTAGNDDDSAEKALRELLEQPDLNADLNDLLGNDEDLFGAPTEILTGPGSESTEPNTLTAATGVDTGPMSDAELDDLLDQDTEILMQDDGNTPKARAKAHARSSTDPESATDLGGHTLTMLDRLKGAESDSDSLEPSGRTRRMVSGEAGTAATPSKLQPAQNMSLVNRLRNAFGGKPSDRLS